MKDDVLVVALVQDKPAKELAKIGFIASGPRAYAVRVNRNSHAKWIAWFPSISIRELLLRARLQGKLAHFSRHLFKYPYNARIEAGGVSL